MTAIPHAERRDSSVLRIKAIARRHWFVMVRSPHRLFDVTIWPLVDVLLFGSIATFFLRAEGTDVGRAAFGYLLAGILLWHVVYQSQISLSTGFLEETWSRNLLNLMVTPMREWEYIAGVVVLGLLKLVLGVGAVALLALLAFAFDVTDLGLTLVPIAAVLLMTGWVIALFVIGLVLRFGAGAEALAWGILFVVMPLSGVFYPVDALPGLLQPIARLLPTTHAFIAARSVLDGGGVPWGRLGVAAVAAVVLAMLAVAWVAAMLRLFRTRGYVTRYS
ncbi:MAG TPA: ABC transporter permease [Acidimicrobiales bacterium]|jgi:ABC-2 type transport system permease protein|nr:ABC transporter permease [Acidimicrobiales bacterium]